MTTATSQHLPTLYVPHGAPTFSLNPGAAGAALVRQAQSLPHPRAIVIISPHWETQVPTIGTADRLETIHDFWGFPEELYRLRYPATGCRELAEVVGQAITAAGLPLARDASRGLDHGAWVPLRLMFPEADIPVVSLSLPSHGGPELAYRLGQALAPLTTQGFLIIGSGSITHNLRDYQMAWRNGGQTPAYVREFADWLYERTQADDLPALLAYREQAPSAQRAHPSEEHLLPFYVALGAAGERPAMQRFHAGIDDYVIAMDAYEFLPQ
ncbi:MAG: dioxygenase [Rhodocyclales bacterium]|nr:dioxygenase [Rhodocyclales bacterium]